MTQAMPIYNGFKQDILTCEISPGTFVSEGELRTRYGTGRTPVREACRRLHEQALLQIIPLRGYFVPALTIAEYRNLDEAQLVIEPAAAALAAGRATEGQTKKIKELAEYEYYPGLKTSYCTFLERNYNLHLEIAAASGNKVFEETIANLQLRLMRYYYLVISMDSYGRQLVDEHRALARAVERRDPEMARERAAEHQQPTIGRSERLDIGSAIAKEPATFKRVSHLKTQASTKSSVRRVSAAKKSVF